MPSISSGTVNKGVIPIIIGARADLKGFLHKIERVNKRSWPAGIYDSAIEIRSRWEMRKGIDKSTRGNTSSLSPASAISLIN